MVNIEFLSAYEFTFFDVETTGLDPRYGDRICEVALLKCKNGKTLSSFQSLINPERSISSGAYAVNGISQRMLKDKPLFREVAPKVLSLMENSILICHNVPFDLGFLHAECRREGIEVPAYPIIDTLALARRCFRFYRNSLGDIALDLGIETPHAHRAMADVETTLAVFTRFMQDFKVRGITTLEEIFSLQDSLRYKRPKGLSAIPPHLEEAVENKKPVKIKYASAMGVYTIRTIEPKEIVSDRDYLYLIAFCRLRNAERNFRLDRIIEISPLEKTVDQSGPNINKGYEAVFKEIFKNKNCLAVDMQLIKPMLNKLITNLTERERMILQMRFGLLDGAGKTLQQIGDVLGITRERIRQLERKALRKLKHPSRTNKLRQYVEALQWQK